jgi:hypothetical protein
VIDGTLRRQLAEWRDLFPNPSAPAKENAAARARDDEHLATFAGLDSLTLPQVRDMIDWKFGSMAHRRARALDGLADVGWNGATGARAKIRRALASDDDFEALQLIAGPEGIHRFGPAMGSAILAACRPERFTVADVNALAALRTLERVPSGPPTFRMKDWLGYLEACRALARSCRMSLRDIDRALWVAGAAAATEHRRSAGTPATDRSRRDTASTSP